MTAVYPTHDIGHPWPFRLGPYDEAMTGEHPLLLFDGECSLCSSAVQFVLKHERDSELRFAPLQGEVGRSTLSAHGLDPETLDTLVVVAEGRALVRSDAAFELVRHLGPWRVLRALRIVPRGLRDWVYDFVAKRRYRWFGKRDACWMPQPEHRGRFLDVG